MVDKWYFLRNGDLTQCVACGQEIPVEERGPRAFFDRRSCEREYRKVCCKNGRETNPRAQRATFLLYEWIRANPDATGDDLEHARQIAESFDTSTKPTDRQEGQHVPGAFAEERVLFIGQFAVHYIADLNQAVEQLGGQVVAGKMREATLAVIGDDTPPRESERGREDAERACVQVLTEGQFAQLIGRTRFDEGKVVEEPECQADDG